MTASAASGTNTRQHLSFVVGGTDFGIPILKVKELLQYEGVTRIPGTPPAVRGVLNVRGAVVPVIDLGMKFGQGSAEVTKRTCVLVVEAMAADSALVLGVMADAVSEVVDLAADEIEPPPSLGTGRHLEHVTGIGKVGKKFVILLDIDRVLTAAEGADVASAAASAEALRALVPNAAPSEAAAP